MSQETIIAKTYDLLKFSLPSLAKFPRNHKFTLGDRIQTMLGELLELTIEAYYAPKSRKKELLHRINILLEKLRYYFRLCFDLALYPSTRYGEFAKRLDEIGRMCGGWLKSLDN